MHALCQQGMFWKAGHTSLHTLPLMLLLFTISRSSGVKQPWQDVTWMPLELPMRDHELEVFCEYGNKLSAQGNNTCSMEFAKLRRRCIVALCLVCIILEARQETCLKRKCIIPERLCHYRSSNVLLVAPAHHSMVVAYTPAKRFCGTRDFAKNDLSFRILRVMWQSQLAKVCRHRKKLR